MPFHRVEEWVGDHFEPSWLSKAGVRLHTGHAGKPCPSAVPLEVDGRCHKDMDDGWEDDDVFTAEPSSPSKTKKNEVVVVDHSGIHRLPIRWCRCADPNNIHRRDLELLQIGLYPASFKNIQTVFTFGVLDDFLLENLECKTSAMNFYSKLRRMTTKAFPDTVPDRYRELLRVSRQWRHLKYLKWHGVGHPEIFGQCA
jgi:CxC2 like cysteine cluster associated with KDZ transposases